MNKTGTGEEVSTSKPKINEYRGGARIKPRKMNDTDAVLAASASVDKSVQAVKDIKKTLENQIENLEKVTSKIPSQIPARFAKDNLEKIENLTAAIKTADFTPSLRQAMNQAASGWLGAHKVKAWSIFIGSILLMLVFALAAINSSVRQGKAEAEAELYKNYANSYAKDAAMWREFKERNPKKARRFEDERR
jgi:hypothetical protein